MEAIISWGLIVSEGTAIAASEDQELLSAMEELERIQQRVAQLRQQSREKAIADVREKIKMYVLTAEELGFAKIALVSKPSRNNFAKQPNDSGPPAPGSALNLEISAADGRSRVKPKYISSDGRYTWSGRGKVPGWMQPLLDKGAKKEDFLVDKSGAGTAE